ncbi:ribbon-helix-helix protein, CopG family [Vulcanisaeta distributa]|uniref:ribbon-helix-helix protein, CopG family n=1 Tax=Vulcanisaeta distributa TaxID=164451 RepID=UPI0006D13006|nr:ribbon-helix-helix protein, CopG family [Vulcanisaeta distributa]
MRFRCISVREDVYEALRRLSEVSNATMSDLIRQLLTTYMAMNEIRELLKQCMSQSIANANLNNEVAKTESIKDSIKEAHEELINDSLIGIEDNPWVQIIRSRVIGSEDREGGH